MAINLKMLHAVSALIVDENSRVLLLKRNEIGYNGYWQFPEGKIDNKETPLQAIKRELREEIGASDIKILSKGKVYFSQFVYRGLAVTMSRRVYRVEAPAKIVLSAEHSEYGWYTAVEAETLRLVPGVKEIIRLI